ncbi:MAG: NTP transferase domain-containing protein [Candidatus Magasanikbacteria bacterium]|nr:NTP transferase domain-containing protein [Candidatus Magasanikbacteria bacterium]
MSKFAVVILAAGKGKRMGADLPKVLHLFHGRPFIVHLVDEVKKSGICERPTVVVCDEHDLVQKILGDSCDYVVQEEQLGTAHAVQCVENFLSGRVENVLVLYGDHPLLKAETLRALRDLHEKVNHHSLSLMTTVLPDFDCWRAAFQGFGRIVRNQNGEIEKIIEFKDAADDEKKILEVNPMYCCFKADWLWENLKKIDNNNAQKEYYLTDLVQKAVEQGEKIAILQIPNVECLGINRPEELEMIQKMFEK